LIAGNGQPGFRNGAGSQAQFNGPYTIDISSNGQTLYIADKYNNAIRTINVATANVTTLVGKGTAGYRDGGFTQAALAIPEYVEEDNGTVYWTEAGTNTVRAANLGKATVTTISGNGQKGLVNGAGASAEWSNPKGIIVRAGKLYVADYLNDVIRSIEL
jgi:DNA-binding beta-propeller fold protein YncE